MTVDEYMRDASGIVYIGCANGSNFFFVGDADEYGRMIDGISDRYLSNIEKRVRVFESQLRRIPADDKRGRQAAEQNLADARRELADYKGIREREIVEQYPHTFEDPGPTLLVEGNIVGKYWSREEFVKGEGIRKQGRGALSLK